MGLFDDLFGEEKKRKRKKGQQSLYDWLGELGEENKSLTKPRKRKPTYKDLEAYYLIDLIRSHLHCSFGLYLL